MFQARDDKAIIASRLRSSKMTKWMFGALKVIRYTVYPKFIETNMEAIDLFGGNSVLVPQCVYERVD